MMIAPEETRAAMRTAVADYEAQLGSETIDEMAVPSYLRRGLVSRHVFWRKLHWIIQVAELRPDTNIFDFGCGTGVLLPTLSADGRTVTATDLHLELARRLVDEMRLTRINFVTPDAWEQHLPDGQIDTVIAANVLEHIEDRRSLLKIFASKLAPGGRIVISGPTENAMYKLGRKLIGFSGDYHVTTIHHILDDARAVGLRPLRLKRWPLPGPACLYQIAAFGRGE